MNYSGAQENSDALPQTIQSYLMQHSYAHRKLFFSSALPPSAKVNCATSLRGRYFCPGAREASVISMTGAMINHTLEQIEAPGRKRAKYIDGGRSCAYRLRARAPRRSSLYSWE